MRGEKGSKEDTKRERERERKGEDHESDGVFTPMADEVTMLPFN